MRMDGGEEDNGNGGSRRTVRRRMVGDGDVKYEGDGGDVEI